MGSNLKTSKNLKNQPISAFEIHAAWKEKFLAHPRWQERFVAEAGQFYLTTEERKKLERLRTPLDQKLRKVLQDYDVEFSATGDRIARLGRGKLNGPQVFLLNQLFESLAKHPPITEDDIDFTLAVYTKRGPKHTRTIPSFVAESILVGFELFKGKTKKDGNKLMKSFFAKNGEFAEWLTERELFVLKGKLCGGHRDRADLRTWVKDFKQRLRENQYAPGDNVATPARELLKNRARTEILKNRVQSKADRFLNQLTRSVSR